VDVVRDGSNVRPHPTPSLTNPANVRRTWPGEDMARDEEHALSRQTERRDNERQGGSMAHANAETVLSAHGLRATLCTIPELGGRRNTTRLEITSIFVRRTYVIKQPDKSLMD